LSPPCCASSIEQLNAKHHSVLLNAGMGNYVYGLAHSIGEGVELAKKTLLSGKAIMKLDEWIGVSKQAKLTIPQ